ncbi:uncharacterized protein LOC110830068 isoform X2 [Zootermopsis nevadensis]|uniref:uncharacterized protein LOC110830068 isoform X2 n=1 Tax=Zootermopsis nevadensis TaxID=136037 RepID=UPI000B8E99F5|nr:uncharacterized protein LOC110830068 isoform X2 [Zootermopsis nevadensis]
MSEGKVFASEGKSIDEDEPEEGEIQDDGSLEDVSSDEDTPSICCRKANESSYGNKYPISQIVKLEYVTHSHNCRVPKACKRKSKCFSSTTEGNQSRLNVIKYKEQTNKSINDVYHVTLNPAVDDRRREDNFVDMLSEYKSVRPKQIAKDEDIVQEKENRHDCQKETTVKRKCKRKRRHSLLNNPKPRRPLSSDSKPDSEVGSRVEPGEEEKKKDAFMKLETRSKCSHSKKRSVSSKREKHRWSKKKDSRKCLIKKLSNTIEKNDCSGHGNSLLKRLQTMMTTNVSIRKENIVESVKKNEDSIQGQELEHSLRRKLRNLLPPVDVVTSNNENSEGTTEITNQNELDIDLLPVIKQPEPVVITIDDSDSELLECDLTEKVNKKDKMKSIGDKEGVKQTDDIDEDDLVQLRLLALQSNRRKETIKPKLEDDEVMQLRLEALKSAILKKCQVRKQRGVTLKTKKINIVNSPFPSEFEIGSGKGESGHEVLKPEVISKVAVPSEPDETTTLVDMDLSHTDDESSAQNEIITDPISGDIPLPTDSTSTFLQLTHEDHSTHNVPCINEPLFTVEDNPLDLKLNQSEEMLLAWNPAVAVCRSPETAKFDPKTCQLPGICSSNVQVSSLNSVNYSNSQLPFPSSSFPPQQLYNELCDSNNSSDLQRADLDGVPLEALSSQFDSCLSPSVSGSFVSSDINSPVISNALITSKIGVHVPITETEVRRRDAVMCAQLYKMDPTNVSYQDWDGNKKVHLHSKSYVSFRKSLPAAPTKPSGVAESNSSSLFPVPSKLPFSSMNPHIQELNGMKTEIPCQSHYVSMQGRDSTVHKTDFKVEENSSELVNNDLSNMIVLNEVGRCSLPEAKVEGNLNELVTTKKESKSQQWEQSSVNLDEDEEILRAKVLTTLLRKSSTSAVSGPSKVFSKQTKDPLLSVSPKLISPCSISSSKNQHQISLIQRKEKLPSKLLDPSQNLKGCNKTTPRVLSKKLEHSQSNFSSYSKGSIIRTNWWKKSLRKGFPGTNIKQILVGVNRNPSNMKQVRVPSGTVSSDAQSMSIEVKKASNTQCKPVGNPLSRVVFHPRVFKPTTIQVTVPTEMVDDERCRRKIAESSVASVQHTQRFVIRLGEDSDSQDEEDKITPAPKRRCVIKNDSSVPLLTVSTSATHVAPCDPPANCDNTIASSISSHLAHPLSGKQNTCSIPTQPVSSDFEKSVDIFLKQARKSQEARANSVIQKNLTPDKSTGGKANPISSVTPLAVRHLPSSQQEEYHRLKQQIVELEEQRKRCQQQQKPLPKNMTNTKLTSLTSAENKEVSQSSHASAKVASDSKKIFRTSHSTYIQGNVAVNEAKQQYPAGHALGSTGIMVSGGPVLTMASNVTQTAFIESPSHLIVSTDALLQNSAENVSRTVCTAASVIHISKKLQGETSEKSEKLESMIRKEEESVMGSEEHTSLKDGVLGLSACKSDGLASKGIACDESLDDKEEKLAQVEHQLLSKRYEILDDLTSMTALLHKVKIERAKEDECLTELHRVRRELCQAEEQLAHQRELLSNMCNDMAESHRRVARGRAECIGLSKSCLSLGICVKGRHYKVPAGGAELMNLKLQQVGAQTRQMSKKKEYLEDSDENQAIINFQMPVQDKTTVRKACIAYEGTEDNTQISNTVCASPALDVNEESGLQKIKIVPSQSTENSTMLVTKSDISQPKYMSCSDTLGFKLLEQPFAFSVPSSSAESKIDGSAASKSDKYVSVPSKSESDCVLTEKDQNGVSTMSDVKEISTGVSEDLRSEATEIMVMGMSSSSKETVLQHIAKYRSPLEHLHSKRQGIILQR